MPLSKAHKQQSRERILQSAVELFSLKGFNNVSIDDLMKHAKLTRGAFYSHFESKNDVYMHAITAAASNSELATLLSDDLSNTDWLARFVGGYLSLRHVRQECRFPCPIASLVTDVSNSELEVKQTYTEVFRAFTGLVKQRLSHEDDESRRHALSMAIGAMMIGSVAIGRALSDNKLQRQLLESTEQIAMQLIGGVEELTVGSDVNS